MRQIAKAVAHVDAVDGVEAYKGTRVDVVVHFTRESGVMSLRKEWLENWRDDFEIVDYNRGEHSWMQLKAK